SSLFLYTPTATIELSLFFILLYLSVFLIILSRPPRSTLFPYTTLFRSEIRGGRDPFLRVMPHEAAIELGRRHHPMQHRRQIEIRRHRLRTVRVRIDVEEVAASGRQSQRADQHGCVCGLPYQNPTMMTKLTPRGIGRFPKSIPTAPEPPTAAVFPLMMGSRP